MNAFLEAISGKKLWAGIGLMILVAVGREFLPGQMQIWDYLYPVACGIIGAGAFDKVRKSAEGA